MNPPPLDRDPSTGPARIVIALLVVAGAVSLAVLLVLTLGGLGWTP